MTDFMRFFILALLFAASVVHARQGDYDVLVANVQRASVPVQQNEPVLPNSGFRAGQAGWVRVHFYVTPEGQTMDPIVVDSAGGFAFEEAVLDAVENWRYEASGAELTANVVDIRFERRQGRETATRDFLRRYQRIMTRVLEEKTDHARRQVDAAVARSGWNLYEETMLALMVGQVEGLENDPAGKLEYYLRATSMASQAALEGFGRRDALTQVFELQHQHGQYGSAQVTLAALHALPAGSEPAKDLTPMADEIRRALGDSAPITVQGRLHTPCKCEEGRALWHYQPIRSEFSFANLSGNVESFEARCMASRIGGDPRDDTQWTLPERPGNCRIFVFGSDAATFEILEHASEETAAGLMGNDGLDRTN